MSRSLPPLPSLEHLKKQAKELLEVLKQQNPASQLADAQHALASEYGFANWTKLKAHVESLRHIEKTNPFVGRWTANLSRSRRHPSRQFQQATLEFTLNGELLALMDTVVEESGQQNISKSTILGDGKEHPSEDGNGYILVAKWSNPNLIAVLAKKGGQVAGWGTYEVSEDGKTMTITGDEQRIMLDRIGG